MSESPSYTFEQEGKISARKVQDNDPDYKILTERMSGHNLDNVARILLKEIIIHVHQNIHWYQTEMVKQQKLRKGFFWGSLFLLLLIPAGIFMLTKVTVGDQDTQSVTVLITAFLAGIIGFHSAVSQLLEKRNLVSLYHKASSGMKKIFYEFEDRWKTEGIMKATMSDESKLEWFKQEAEILIQKAKDIEDEERAEYFRLMANYPVINLGTALLSAGKTATSLRSQYSYMPAAPEKKTGDRVSLTALNQQLSQIKQYKLQLENQLQDATDKKQKNLIRDQIHKLQEMIIRVEQQILELKIMKKGG